MRRFPGPRCQWFVRPKKVASRSSIMTCSRADQEQMTKEYTERAVGFIKENADNPFFLYLPAFDGPCSVVCVR